MPAMKRELERDADRSINCRLMLIYYLLPLYFGMNVAIDLVQRSPLNRNLVTMTDKNVFNTDWHLLKMGHVTSRIHQTYYKSINQQPFIQSK